MMDVRTLRREMNRFFAGVESLQRSLSKFGGKAVLTELKNDKKKRKEKKESQPHTGK